MLQVYKNRKKKNTKPACDNYHILSNLGHFLDAQVHQAAQNGLKIDQ